MASRASRTDGLCEAVGYYAIASSGDNAMTVLDRGGTWRGGQTVPEPVAVGSSVPVDFLYGVTCQQSGSCAAVGNFVNFLSQYQPMWAPVTTPPSPVTSINEGPTSPSEANVTWTPSVVTGAGIDHFEVYESVDGGVNYADLGSSGTATTMHVTGLVPGHVYHFEVVAVDVALVGSGPTYSTYTQAVPPSAPRSLHATVMHHGASLSWSAPASSGFAPITSYTVTVTWPGGHTVKVVTSPHLVLAGLLHTRTYGFSVRAANKAGPGPSSPVVHFVPGV